MLGVAQREILEAHHHGFALPPFCSLLLLQVLSPHLPQLLILLLAIPPFRTLLTPLSPSVVHHELMAYHFSVLELDTQACILLTSNYSFSRGLTQMTEFTTVVFPCTLV